MALILNGKYHDLRVFYFNRFLRIYSTYWLIIAMMLVLMFASGKQTMIQQILAADIPISKKICGLFMNFTIVGIDWVMLFDVHSANFIMIGQAWSLPLEIYFYIMAPFIVKSWRMIIGLFVFSLCSRYLFYTYPEFFPTSEWGYRCFFSNLIFFLMGVMAYNLAPIMKMPVLLKWMGYLLLSSVMWHAKWFNIFEIPHLGLSSADILIGLLFIIFLPLLFRDAKSNKYDRLIGDLSYPVYLCHSIIALAAAKYLGLSGPQGEVPIVLIILCVSLVLSLFYSELIERRFKRSDPQTLNLSYGTQAYHPSNHNL